MIEGLEYVETVKSFFSFLKSNYDFKKIKQTINGNAFYDVEYMGEGKVVSISYENIEDHLEIIVFKLQNGEMPDYDDKSRTLHLSQLNAIVMPKADKSEMSSNNRYFAKFHPKDELERMLLKSAKELRLYLKYFNLPPLE
ncbi:MAG: hypothetical protein ABIO46_12410 [Chitinophagales bacterium]